MSTLSKTPTILQILPALETGGVERGTIEVSEAIVNKGWKSIVVSNGGAMVRHLDRMDAKHISLAVHTKNPFKIFFNSKKLAKILKENQVDIVHARSRAPAWSAYLACKKTKTPFITTFHGTYNFSNFLKKKYNAIMTKGQATIAISKFISNHIQSFYKSKKETIHIIHRGVDIDLFNIENVTENRLAWLVEKWNIPEEKHIIILPGRLTKWKGQEVFIKAISKLKNDNIFCIIVGSDQGRHHYRSTLDRLIQKHNLENKISIVDNCNDMPAAYKLASIVVSTSTDPEAFGRVVAEAQAMEKPVIGPDHGGACEIITQDKTGWLTKPGCSDSLAEALTKVLNLPVEKQNEIGKKSRENIEQNFTKDLMCAKTLHLYSSFFAQ